MKHSLATISFALFAIMMSAQPGTLDQTFGSTGYVITDPGNNYNRAFSVVTGSDGSIFAAGSSHSGEIDDFGSDFVVVKYHEDGTLAGDFGSNGIVLTDLNGLSSDVALDIAIQNDGKVLAAGRTHAGNAYENYKLAVVRYNADGTPDDSFGTQGRTFFPVTSYDDYSYNVSMALQPDGKIVVTGSSYVSNNDVFTTVRFTPDGIPDASFGNNGLVTTSLGESFTGNPNAIVIQPDGKILVGGVGVGPLSYGTYADFALVRYEPDGSPDTFFGDNGIVLTPLMNGFNAEWIEDLAVLSDGRILAAGSTSENNDIQRMALVRYNSDGSLDPYFGESGIVLTNIGSTYAYANGLAVTENGNILLGGLSQDPSDGISDFAMVKYLPDGSPDNGFGANGIVLTDINTLEGALDLNMDGNGKIVVAGLTGNPGHHDFIVLRYLDIVTGYQPAPQSSVVIYPNPVRDFLTLSAENYQETRILIADVQGKLLLEAKPSSTVTTLDLSHLAGGIYILLLEKNGAILSRNRIIKMEK